MVYAFFVFIAGLIIGSFLNVVIFRLNKDEQFIKGRSKCLSCGYSLSFWDLLPVISFIWLKAKCRKCQAKISWQYPLVELATGVIFIIGYYHYLANNISLLEILSPEILIIKLLPFLAYLIFSCFLLLIFVYDFKYYLILDKVSLSAFVLALIFNVLLGKPILNLLLAALVLGGFFALLYIISKGKWIGGGDIRLGLAIGAMLGWPNVWLGFYVAVVSGALFGLVLICLKKKQFKSQLPFGTFLALAAWVVYLWPQQIGHFIMPTIF